MFEHMLQVYEINMAQSAFQLASQLTGKVQQAYTTLSVKNATSYVTVKVSILRRYDISKETYRQRFQSICIKKGEVYLELAVHHQDLLRKWMFGWDMV